MGELDMLLEDRQGNCIHLECAVKFYLAHQPGIRDWQNWIGPNARDRLDIKLQRMLTHQLPLAKHATARPYLESREQNPRKVQSRYFLRGMFFPHSDSPECLPAHANQAALTGCWLHREKFASEDHHQWRALARLDWLTGSPSHQPRSKVVSPPEMLCRRTPEGRVEKRMLVDDYWPETNSPSRRI